MPTSKHLHDREGEVDIAMFSIASPKNQFVNFLRLWTHESQQDNLATGTNSYKTAATHAAFLALSRNDVSKQSSQSPKVSG
jgi:hypothetical protein